MQIKQCWYLLPRRMIVDMYHYSGHFQTHKKGCEEATFSSIFDGTLREIAVRHILYAEIRCNVRKMGGGDEEHEHLTHPSSAPRGNEDKFI